MGHHRVYSYSLYLCSLILFLSFCKSYALTLTIGTLSYNPPYEIQLTNTQKQEFYGFEINLMDEICKRIKAKCQYKAVLFQDIFSKLNSGEIDLGIATISVTSERSQNFLFSMPYIPSSSQFLVLANSNFTNPEDLKGKAIGVFRGSSDVDLAKEYFKNNIQLTYYDTAENMLNALDNQEISALIADSGQVSYWADNSMSTYKLLGNSIPNPLGYAIMTKLGQDALIKQINQALIDMENDGTYLQIYNLTF